MTPRERFLTALAGEMPDRIPMVLWNNKLPGGDLDNQIFELGVCLIVKSCVWHQQLVGVNIDRRDEKMPGGSMRGVTTFHTPKGDLTTVERVFPGTVWIEKFPFENKKDYDALEVLIASRSYKQDYDGFLADDTVRGEQSLARPTTIHSPMQDIIYEFMGIETFSFEYKKNPDHLLHLIQVLKEDWKARVEMTASSPACFAVIEGNTEFSVIGPDRFEKFFYPHIQEASEILHAHDILTGAHLDSNNKHLAPLIAETDLDFVESFTPYPETDLSISEAKHIWPDKALQIHFPSSVHLGGKEKIEAVAKEYLQQALPGNGFVVGVSEDLPNRGVDTLVPLFQFFRDKGKLPLKN